MVNQRRSAALIETMRLDNGRVLASPKEIHDGAAQHFQDFLTYQHNQKTSDISPYVSVEISEEDNEYISS